MNEQESGKLRSIAWSELFPWLILARVFRLSISLRSLALATCGLLLMAAGWYVIGSSFRAPNNLPADTRTYMLGAVPLAIPDRPRIMGGSTQAAAEAFLREKFPGIDVRTPELSGWPSARALRAHLHNSPWGVLTSPLLSTLGLNHEITWLAESILMGLWSLAVWAFFGAAITRASAVQLACDERLTWGSTFRHTTSRWKSYLVAPLFPAIGIVMIALPIAILGFLTRGEQGLFLLFSFVVSFLFWPLCLAGGLLMALLLLGLLFGWPLMWATISTEGTDAFDALSRSYAYTFQRPLHYLFYVIVAVILGALGWLLVSEFAAGVIWLTYWAASWGSGTMPIKGTGATGILFWVGCVKWVAVSYLFSYFWTASSAIYLLLRRDVDAEEMDKVALEEEEPSYELPPLKTEGADAPIVEDSGE